MQTVLYVSTGIQMWALNGYSLVDGYPKYIHKLGLPKKIRKIDAAVHIRDTGKTLLFTDEEYWRYVVNDPLMFVVKYGNPTSLQKLCLSLTVETFTQIFPELK